MGRPKKTEPRDRQFNLSLTAAEYESLVRRAQAVGMAFRAQVSRTAHGLEVETGGRGYVLAGGMDKTTAFGLLSDVSRVLGLNVG